MTMASNGMIGTENAFVQLAASGEVLPAVAGYRYRVYGFIISSLLATNVKFQSAATDISLTMNLPATGGIVVGQINLSWFKTAIGEALNLNMSAATTVGVQVIYDLVDF